MKDRDVLWFRPLWRRLAVTAVCLVWLGLELWHGDQVWVLVTLALSGYAVWNLFIAYPKALAAIDAREEAHVPPQA